MHRQYLHIEFCQDYTLDFSILDTDLAKLWLERMNLRHEHLLDHPDRFYGFDSYEFEVARAETMIRRCVDIINDYQPIIDRPFTSVQDQDCINYFHSIFEHYHESPDRPRTRWWLKAPQSVKKALSELNLAVHRCEHVARKIGPKLICTWFGIPRNVTLDLEVMQTYGIINPEFGTVCLNYMEVGKTMVDLMRDQDTYIGEDFFKPFSHYGADFCINFWEMTEAEVDKLVQNLQQYYDQHRDFFVKRGYDKFDHVQLMPLYFPVAKLISAQSKNQIIENLQARQLVTRVYIDETMHHTHS
jgi:hypothetical protein